VAPKAIAALSARRRRARVRRRSVDRRRRCAGRGAGPRLPAPHRHRRLLGRHPCPAEDLDHAPPGRPRPERATAGTTGLNAAVASDGPYGGLRRRLGITAPPKPPDRLLAALKGLWGTVFGL